MLDDTQNKYVAMQAQKICRHIFDIVTKDANELGNEVATNLLYTVLGTIISTDVGNTIGKEETPEEATIAYSAAKQNIERTVAAAFEKAFATISPGTTPEFQCDIMMIDMGIDDGKSY